MSTKKLKDIKTPHEKIATRMREAIKSSGLKEVEFAEKLGIHKSALSKYLAGHHALSYEMLQKVVEHTECDSGWLLTGEGEVKRGKAEATGEEVILTPVYAYSGAGGPLELYEHDPVAHVRVPNEWQRKKTQTIKIRGKSMEPLIHDGAIVGYDPLNKRLISGDIYAIWIDYEGAIIKRLFFEKDRIVVRSDNREFPESIIKKEELNENNFLMGKVLWMMQEV